MIRVLFQRMLLAVFAALACTWGLAAIAFSLVPAASAHPHWVVFFTAVGSGAIAAGMVVVARRRLQALEDQVIDGLETGRWPDGKHAGALAPLLAALRPGFEELHSDAEQQARRADRLASVLRSIDTAVLALDDQHRVLYANDACARVFRWPQAPHAGSRVQALQRIQPLLAWTREAVESQTSRSGRLDLPDERTLQIEVTPLENVAGGFVILARDITETARLENIRRDFVAGISHELQTPLTSIRGYAETLLQEPGLVQASRTRFLEVIVQNAKRLSKLAQDLVTLSSIETGTYPFQFRPVDLASLIGPAIAVMQPLAQAHDCTITVSRVEPGVVSVDPQVFERVLLNLLDNAVRHGGDGTHISIEGSAVQDYYQLTVKDTGRGISSQDRLRVFERFYRVDKSHSNGGGSGLGLALVKHIVREHGGEIELESALGQGSTFRIRLPLVQDAKLERGVNAR